MAKASPIQTSFNAGELSPKLYGRVDFDKYRSAVATSLNGVSLIQGGWLRRPGTMYVAETKDSSKAARLVSFEFSTTQAYILEFGHQYIRFYKDNGQIESGGSPYEIASPYGSTELDSLQFAQSADVLYIAHPDYAPRKLSRTSHTSWTLTEITFDWPPFLTGNVDTAQTILASATTGTVTLTATGFTFDETLHVGSYWKLSETIGSKHDQWKTDTSVSLNDQWYYAGNVYEATNLNGNNKTGTRPPIHTEGTESDGKISWTYRHSGSGYVKITAVAAGGATATATVVSRLPDSVTSTATWQWAEGAWSEKNGYPAALTFFEDRLWWAATSNNPQTMWASVSGEYENHNAAPVAGIVTDDAALALTLNAGQVNVIRWMADDEKGLMVGTVGGEWIVGPATTTEALSPTNILALRSTTYGCAAIQPIRAGKAVLYVQRAGTKVRELAYVFEADGFRAPDMTLLSDHITSGGIVDTAYQQEPHSIHWAVRTDGTLLALVYDRDQDVVGWHRCVLGGNSDASGTQAQVESVAVIPSADGARDELWMVVKRYIDGATKRYVEYLTKFWEDGDDQEDAFFVDCGLTYSGAAATTISGLDHLEGETVSVLADGATHPDATVSSGQITLDRSATKVHVGYGYNSDGKSLRLEAGAQDGTAQGKTKRIHRVVIRLNESLGLKVGPSFDNLDTVYFRTSADEMDTAPALFTGDKEVLWDGDYETEGQLCWRQDQPLPLHILALMPQVVTQDR